MAKKFEWRLKGFRGLSIPHGSSRSLEEEESPEMMNFRIGEDGALEKREGFCCVKSIGEEGLRGIWYGPIGSKRYCLAVIGTYLYISQVSFSDLVKITIPIPGEGKVNFFLFHEKVYLLTGEDIYVYDGELVKPLEPYIPTVMIATDHNGNGTLYEERNILTPLMRQRFSPDGSTCTFITALRSQIQLHWIRDHGKLVETNVYYWDDIMQRIVFVNPPRAGIDSLEVCFSVGYEEDTESADRIRHCRFALGFGGGGDTRAFLYGNEKTPCIRYHSGMAEGVPSMAYFPETAFTSIGSGEAITGMIRHFDRQLIFTEKAAFYSYLDTITLSGEQKSAFPVLPLSDAFGNLAEGEALLVENTPTTLDAGGLCEWVETNIRDERCARIFSEPIAQLLQELPQKDAVLFYRKTTSELYVAFDEIVLVWNVRRKVFYPYSVRGVKGFAETENELYFYTDDGIYRFGGHTDEEEPIRATWRSKLLDLPDANRKKHLFHASLLAESTAPTVIKASFRRENDTEKITREFCTKGEKEYALMRRRMPLNRYGALELSLEEESGEALRITQISLEGAVTEEACS